MNDDNDLLSMEALNWLKNKANYASRDHEERMILIQAARILYPNP